VAALLLEFRNFALQIAATNINDVTKASSDKQITNRAPTKVECNEKTTLSNDHFGMANCGP
jgi:hypothetical protein